MNENKKTPQDVRGQEELNRYKIGGYPTLVKLPLCFSQDDSKVVATISVEIYDALVLKDSIHSVIERGCVELLKHYD